jgi:hypothetical protein
MPSTFIAGCDLGQSNDPSTLAVAEVKDHRFLVRHLHRWQLGTSYPAIIDNLARLYSRPPLAGSTLVLDASGVGRPVVDGLRAKRIDAHMVPVVITAGFQAGHAGGFFSVPKTDLVGAIRMLLGQGRLRICAKLPLAKAAQRESENYTLKVTEKGFETYENASPATHDDLVIALALIAWYGQRRKITAPLRTLTLNKRPPLIDKHLNVATAAGRANANKVTIPQATSLTRSERVARPRRG